MCYGMVSPAGSRRAVAVAGVISMSTLSANLKLSYMTEVDVINVIISWLGEKACRKVHFRLQLTNPTNKPTTNDWITWNRKEAWARSFFTIAKVTKGHEFGHGSVVIVGVTFWFATKSWMYPSHRLRHLRVPDRGKAGLVSLCDSFPLFLKCHRDPACPGLWTWLTERVMFLQQHSNNELTSIKGSERKRGGIALFIRHPIRRSLSLLTHYLWHRFFISDRTLFPWQFHFSCKVSGEVSGYAGRIMCEITNGLAWLHD